MDKLKEDKINHPKHYTSHPSGIECIEITRHLNFNIGNAFKYLWRCGIKDENTATIDLEKAIWYIRDEITRLDKNIKKCGDCGNKYHKCCNCGVVKIDREYNPDDVNEFLCDACAGVEL